MANQRTENSDQMVGERESQISFEIFSHCLKIDPQKAHNQRL
jgi:hypothetical protein